MTYREAIQSQAKKIEEVYDNAGHLRDAATEHEKDYWNDVRTLTSQAAQLLNKLDNKLPAERASLPLKGKY